MKKRLIAFLFLLCSLICSNGLLSAMDADQKKREAQKRQERANFKRLNQETMLQAFDAGKMSQVFDCLSSGASIDTLIIHAFTRNHDLNQTDLNGRTFLHYAVLFGTQQTIEKLVSNGANPFVIDTTGQSPMGLLLSELANAKKNSQETKQKTLMCTNKHTDACNKLSTKINADKTAYLAEQRKNKATIKDNRLKELKKSLDDGLIDQEKFKADCDAIDRNFDGLLEASLTEYSTGRDNFRDKMLLAENTKLAKELAALKSNEQRFDRKILNLEQILAFFTNALTKRPDFKNSALENHLKGTPSDLTSYFQASIEHIDFIKKVKKVCPVITALSVTIILRYVYISLAAASQLSSLKNHLLRMKTALLNIDFDIHNAESVFKPVEEMCDVEGITQDEEQQAALGAAIARFDELVLTLCNRIKEKYFYHPASYFVEQEAVLVNELEQTHTTILAVLEENQKLVSIKKSMKILMGSALVGTVTGAYALYANPLKKWGLFS